ncbi:MAG: family 1 encapsulin nanocompartment shell protein [Microthrixaceae bacterium]
MNHLLRNLAPISDDSWSAIEEEASTALKELLAARRIVDCPEARGWEFSSITTGRIETLESPEPNQVEARIRSVQPLVEFRTPFSLTRSELDAVDRGACDADLDPVRHAARRAANVEDHAVFHGYAPGGIIGITEASPHDPIIIGSDYDAYPSFVARATARLKLSGVGGPYAIALGPRCFTGVMEQSEMGGYPVLEHLRLILGGPVVFAPGVNGAVVVSQRGGDFELILGEDFSVGYSSHDADSVNLFIEESFTVRTCSPEAAVYLSYDD